MHVCRKARHMQPELEGSGWIGVTLLPVVALHLAMAHLTMSKSFKTSLSYEFAYETMTATASFLHGGPLSVCIWTSEPCGMLQSCQKVLSDSDHCHDSTHACVLIRKCKASQSAGGSCSWKYWLCHESLTASCHREPTDVNTNTVRDTVDIVREDTGELGRWMLLGTYAATAAYVAFDSVMREVNRRQSK